MLLLALLGGPPLPEDDWDMDDDDVTAEDFQQHAERFSAAAKDVHSEDAAKREAAKKLMRTAAQALGLRACKKPRTG